MIGVVVSCVVAVVVVGLAVEYVIRHRRTVSAHKLFLFGGRLAVYVEPVDLWVGSYLHTRYLYVCPLPMLVFRWEWPHTTNQGDPLDGAMHSVWLHGQWRWLTSNMTTEKREAAVAAVIRYSAALNDGDDDPVSRSTLVWWES